MSSTAIKSGFNRNHTFSAKADFSNKSSFAVSKTASSPPSQKEIFEKEDRETVTIRRWESAQTNRLNESQWVNVSSQPINHDLIHDRKELVARSRYERRNNPIVEGVIDSFAIDVVGETGPSLFVESDNEVYNRIFKEVWEQFWETLEVTGMHGVDLLTRLVGQDWDNGDWLNRIVKDNTKTNTPVASRLLDIDPERMDTDPKYIGTKYVTMGVERDKLGRPQFYHVRKLDDQFLPPYFALSQEFDRIPAEDIIHCFVSREPGQVRGFPSIASCLQELADLRDYDNQTLDAARLAASSGGIMWTTDAQLVTEEQDRGGDCPEKISFERQTIKRIPAGYQFTAMVPTNPTAQYIDFRHEKLRSLGRVKHMPLLMVLLSAEQSNFSQSRIDINVIYQRGILCYQRWIERNWLSRLVDIVRKESFLAFRPGATSSDRNPFLLPREPERVSYKFGWEPLAQANPKDAILVQERKIKLGLTTPEWEHAKAGTSEEDAIISLARTNQKRIAAGLKPISLGEKTSVNAGQK